MVCKEAKVRYLVVFMTICFMGTLGAVETEDLGSASKIGGSEKKVKVYSPDLSEVKRAQESFNQVDSVRGDIPSGDPQGSQAQPFYKKIGKIRIRATEEYVYIRAGDSVIIMDSSGKVLIDSAHDLFFKSNKNIVLKAKKDIILSPKGSVIMPRVPVKKEEAKKKDKKN